MSHSTTNNGDRKRRRRNNESTDFGREGSRGQQQRQGRRSSPNSNHSFLDATAAVSVATFGSRRLPELERLYGNVVTSRHTNRTNGTNNDNKRNSSVFAANVPDLRRPYLSGGGKLSSRHLRRRTTSVQTRKHYHRYPCPSSSPSSSIPVSSPAPPWQGRTRKSKRKKLSLLKEPHVRWLQEGTKTNDASATNESSAATTTTTTTAATKWLMTHLWHTKRCHVLPNLWGWSVPVMHTNRGPRAALRLGTTSLDNSKNNKTNISPTTSAPPGTSPLEHCLLRDVSWECQPVMYIQVGYCHNNNCCQKQEGKEEEVSERSLSSSSLNSIKNHVLENLGRVSPHLLSTAMRSSIVPSSSSSRNNSSSSLTDKAVKTEMTRTESFLSGRCMVDCYLYEVDEFPNHAIGPVSWRILSNDIDDTKTNITKNDKTTKEYHDDHHQQSEVVTVEARCHPSIQSRVGQCLTELMADNNERSTLSPSENHHHHPFIWKQVSNICNTTSAIVDENNGQDQRNDRQIDDYETTNDVHKPIGSDIVNTNDNGNQPNNGNRFGCGHLKPKVCFRLYGGSTKMNIVFNQICHLSIDNNSCDERLTDNRSDCFFNDNDNDDNITLPPEDCLYDGMICHVKISLKDHSQRNRYPNQMALQPSTSEGSSTSASSRAMLVYRSPRPLDCDTNRTLSGWDIHCYDVGNKWGSGTSDGDRDFVHRLWMSLVLKNCCVIGLIEDVHLKLECEPPIPVFPRDAVDTFDAQRYWNGACSSTNESKAAGKTKTPSEMKGRLCSPRNDWGFIRHLYEAGWGRVRMHVTPTRAKFQQNFDFSCLTTLHPETMSDDESVADIDPIVVRDSFMSPFLDALNSCGRISKRAPMNGPVSASSSNNRRQHRKRRTGSSEKKWVVAEKLSKTERTSASIQYQHLLSSLSLPAVLLVHVRSIGQGTIDPGMSIYGYFSCNNVQEATDHEEFITVKNIDSSTMKTSDRMNSKYRMIGRITTGSFSPSRGVCHGIGVIGAARFLDCLARSNGISNSTFSSLHNGKDNEPDAQDQPPCGGLVVRLVNGTKSLQMLVMVGCKSRRNGATDISSSSSNIDHNGNLHPASLSLIPSV